MLFVVRVDLNVYVVIDVFCAYMSECKGGPTLSILGTLGSMCLPWVGFRTYHMIEAGWTIVDSKRVRLAVPCRIVPSIESM
jgi:hypothetical protein